MKDLKPVSTREAVAVFRAEIVGALTRQRLAHGELKARLRELAKVRYRPPGADSTRTFGVSTLERWYYAYKNDGLEGLLPKARSDRGHGRNLEDELVELLLDIRRQHPSAAASVIRDTLIKAGQLERRTISVSTLRRLYRAHDLPRQSRLAGPQGGPQRLRWQAPRPMALWHGDVCHAFKIEVDGQMRRVKVHALLDDASRFVVALEAHFTEKEADMIGLLGHALRRWGMPQTLYLDNGSTYSGEALATACARLGLGLVHAKPYDPQARGKIERFWRTLRGRCLDFPDGVSSLHDVNVRLNAFLDDFYHDRPHAGLMGETPRSNFMAWWRDHLEETALDEARLRNAFTVRKRRRVRTDSTLSHESQTWQVDQSFLCKKSVTVCHCLFDIPCNPWVEYKQKTYPLHAVDPIKNSEKRRQSAPEEPEKSVDFNPAQTMLDHVLGRTPTQKES
jgi:transposase InsO family protein